MQGGSASQSDIGVEKMVIEKRNVVDNEPSIDGGSVEYNEYSSVVDLRWPVQPPVSEETMMQGGTADQTDIGVEGMVIEKDVVKQGSKDIDAANKAKGTATVCDAPKYNPLHKRKRQVSSNLSPTRKSPRFSQVHVDRNVGSRPVGTEATLKQDGKGRGKSSSAAQADGSSARTVVVLSPSITNIPKESGERDGSSARTTVVVSPTVTNTPKESGEIDGSSARTAFVVSPTVTSTSKASMSASKLQEIKDGKKISSAIPISPTVTEPKPDENKCREIIISPRTQQTNAQGSGSSESPYTVSPIFGPRMFSLAPIRRSPMTVPPDVARLVKGLSDSVNKQGLFSSFGGGKPLSDGGSASKRKRMDNDSSSASKKRDDHPGMFTPPPFDLLGGSEESSSIDEAIEAVPIAWAPSQDENEGFAKESTDEDLEEFELSDELKDFILGKIPQVSDKCQEELHRYEDYIKTFSARQRVLQEKAKPGTSEGVRSATPKMHPHKPRVRKASRFKR